MTQVQQDTSTRRRRINRKRGTGTVFYDERARRWRAVAPTVNGKRGKAFTSATRSEATRKLNEWLAAQEAESAQLPGHKIYQELLMHLRQGDSPSHPPIWNFLLITPEQTQQWCNITEIQFKQWVAMPGFPAYDVGDGEIRVVAQDLQGWIREHLQNALDATTQPECKAEAS